MLAALSGSDSSARHAGAYICIKLAACHPGQAAGDAVLWRGPCLIDGTATCTIWVDTAGAGPDSSCLCQTIFHGLGILIWAACIRWPAAAPGSCTQQQELSPAGLLGSSSTRDPGNVKQWGRHCMSDVKCEMSTGRWPPVTTAFVFQLKRVDDLGDGGTSPLANWARSELVAMIAASASQ